MAKEIAALESQIEDLTQRNLGLKTQLSGVLKEKLATENRLIEAEIQIVELQKGHLGKEQLTEMLEKIQQMNALEAKLRAQKDDTRSWQFKAQKAEDEAAKARTDLEEVR